MVTIKGEDALQAVKGFTCCIAKGLKTQVAHFAVEEECDRLAPVDDERPTGARGDLDDSPGAGYRNGNWFDNSIN